MGVLVLKDLCVEAIIVLGGCQHGEWDTGNAEREV